MGGPSLQEDQLLELLLQLKKTTPEQARTILNSQPQIAYALMAVMVNINAVNMDIVQKTLATYGAFSGAASTSQTAPPAPPSNVPPVPAILPHLVPQPPHRGGTPTYPPHPQPSAYPTQGYPAPHPSQHMNTYSAPPPGPQPQIPGLGAYPQPLQAPAGMPSLPPALANIPDEQKALIMRVVTMSRDEIFQLPYAERENIIKLRATLGLPT
ncbi:uncharacterized protein LAESUDRAFT_735808 [Laetiporus sulphureus 93-53]|uniref:Cleavage stimulation factor subunit 2 hinge domain-containing protein n=1 Tax=Laetiporus sulphureus 93-53 TaxID=1314785 RepID=A0A165F9N9_9APHY|nr:uncharacterized protein LAESUDRAFT_735808 [Laetiporus sulphureus 93-53]KZT08641.1 hypothetical protein LAESUDRAFT_735808 [Laetiporus sulphureus 93-53]